MNDRPSEIVKFDNVGLRYGTEPEVLSDVSFTLFPGSFYFLTGASGAGKTSLLKLLYLAQRPSRGSIRMFGKDMITLPRGRLPDFRRRLGVVFQNFRLVQHLSAFDNVALPLEVCGVGRSESKLRVNEALARVGLEGMGRRRPGELSGGEQQRVAIARAVVNRPSIILADEPTGNLDTASGNDILSIFSELHEKGHTLIIVTHDAAVANRANKIIQIVDGLITDSDN